LLRGEGEVGHLAQNRGTTGDRYITAWVPEGVARRAKPSGRRRTARELAVGHFARMDHDRPRRVGVPEVILGEGKTVAHLVGILRRLHRSGLGALISRPTPAQRRALRAAGRGGLPTRELASGRILRLRGPLGVSYRPGVVALLTAGTSDVPIAEEAEAVLGELGLRVVSAHDVGVAGLHRLLRALRAMERSRPEIYLVFAGREGALPTVVAGLVHAPVVGVPTSVGYGRGGRGEAALNAMLQSCAPLAVVNIDAAVPAALFAAQQFAMLPRRRRGGRDRPSR
jgi:pyridinium-3,5-biscarboxylic acid mononucleotide synthase